MLIPRTIVPNLLFPTLQHGDFNLSQHAKNKFNLIVFYRGLHCPLCANYLTELSNLTEEFKKRDVKIIILSSDQKDRAQQMADKIKMNPQIVMGYNLKLIDAKKWGLYISEGRGKTSIGIEEPTKFSEPGVFITREDQTLYYGSTQTMPFARPIFKDLLAAIDFAINKNYPARGEYTGSV
ncbi:MAG: AhpC/TSA family protein [Alphaproteobacteria bacterium]|jgi:peroxiredoxin|nr:AhpC/TSA family protein [Candidatus Fonsibacter sp. PEL55]